MMAGHRQLNWPIWPTSSSENMDTGVVVVWQVITRPQVFERQFLVLRGGQARMATMTSKGLPPVSLAVSIVVRTSASASAAHMAR